MRVQRIKTGFHRIGVVLAAIPALVALGRANAPDDYAIRDTVLIVLLGCGGVYLLMRAIGRIVAKSVEDDSQISN